jgi:hypothetical protein
MTDINELTYAVLCRRENGYWETIAAFNCKPAAIAYSNRCAKGAAKIHLPYEYDVRPIGAEVDRLQRLDDIHEKRIFGTR